MNSLMLEKNVATFGIPLFGKSFFIEVSDELNEEIRIQYEKHNATISLDDFRESIKFERFFPYYSNFFKTSSILSELVKNPYIEQTTKDKIISEVKMKARIEFELLIDKELEEPKNTIYTIIVYDKDGLSFDEIRNRISLGMHEESFKCKNTFVSISSPKIEFGTISEDMGNVIFEWRFTYPIGLINFIELDGDSDGSSVKYVNEILKNDFQSPSDYLFINFSLIKGTIRKKLIKFQTEFDTSLSILTQMDDVHSPEIVIVVDVRGKPPEFKEESRDFIIKTLTEKTLE